MQFETISEFLQFRGTCLCGNAFRIQFSYSHSSTDYVEVRPISSYSIKKDGIVFPLEIESRLHPHGEVSFEIHVSLNHNKISVHPKSFSKTGISPLDFIQRHFTLQSQKQLGLKLALKCSKIEECSYRGYVGVTVPLTFNFQTRQLVSFSMETETIHFVGEESLYSFNSKFNLNETTISIKSPTGQTTDLKIESDKYLRFDFNKEFLINKAKTLILFT